MSRTIMSILAVLAMGLTACGGEAPQAQEPEEGILLNTGQVQGGSAPAPGAPAPRALTMVTVPAGTAIPVQLDTALNSGTAQQGDPFTAAVTVPIQVNNQTVIPAGAKVEGTVAEARPARRGGGNAILSLRFSTLRLPDGSSTSMQATVAEQTDGKGKRNAAIIGGSAAGGAILGRVLGNDSKDAAIGAVVGGAIASGVVFSKEGEQVDLPAGTTMTLLLEEETLVPFRPPTS